MKMFLVYIAGPFRGKSHWDVAQNVRNAEALALEVWRVPGLAALCPHANTAHFQDAAPDDVWLRGDLEMLRRCDAMIMTPDWQRSSGARAEYEFAQSRGIPTFTNMCELHTWHFALRQRVECPTDLQKALPQLPPTFV